MLPLSAWAQGRSFRSPVVMQVWSPVQRKDIPAPEDERRHQGLI